MPCRLAGSSSHRDDENRTLGDSPGEKDERGVVITEVYSMIIMLLF